MTCAAAALFAAASSSGTGTPARAKHKTHTCTPHDDLRQGHVCTHLYTYRYIPALRPDRLTTPHCVNVVLYTYRYIQPARMPMN